MSAIEFFCCVFCFALMMSLTLNVEVSIITTVLLLSLITKGDD